MALNVETYQITKKNIKSTSGIGDVPQEILDRLDVLESNQNTILGEYFFDFYDDRFIDIYKSTVIKSGAGLIPRQYVDLYITGLDKNDDCIDYDKSSGIKYHNNGVSLLNTSTLNGELFLFPIKITKDSIGMKFHSSFVNKSTTGQTDVTLLSDCRLWFTSGVDNIGRLWILRMPQYDTSVSNTVTEYAYLDLYDTDMTLIKTIQIAKKDIVNQSNEYNLYFEASNMIFLDDNTCILTVRRGLYMRNGLTRDFAWSNGWDDNSMTDLIISIKDDGTVKQLGSASGYYFVSKVNYPYYHYGSSKNLMYAKNGSLLLIGGTYSYRSHYQNYDSDMNRNLIGFDIRDLNNITISKSEAVKYPDRADGIGNRWMGNSIIQSNMFTRNDYFYNFVTSVKRIDSGNKLSDIFNLQCGLDVANNTFYSDNSQSEPNQIGLIDEAEDPVVIYTHPGFNGIYYNSSNGKLYIFGNGQDDNAMIRCYDINWTSRIDGKLKVKKLLEKEIELSTSTWGSIKDDTTMNATAAIYPSYSVRGYQSNPWQYMKIINFKNSLHLFYYAPQSKSNNNLCLKYMCLDYELNIISDEIILNRQNNGSDTINNIAHFEVREVNNELIILASKGNIEDYTADLEDNNNKLKLLEFFKIDIVESTVKFYYLNESNNTWIEIKNNDTILFDNPVDYVKVKAILKAGNYGASPKINDFTIQSWTNNGDNLRWSEYYSNKIDCFQGNGKAVIHVDQDAKDGVINWFISFDGGKNYSELTLDEEFAYSHLETVDCRLKAEIGVKDNSENIPQINSYTIKTNHMVFHTDLEEIQINLIKTNFKIDTYANASKNGLLKMTIDTLSDESNIDKANSDYTYLSSTGSVTGKYIQTIPEDVSDNIKTVLLVVDETLNYEDEIDYYVSIDGGITFKEITPNCKTQITNTNSSKCSLILRAVMKGNAKLNAWGIAWN